MTLQYKTVVTGSFAENCYIVYDKDKREGILIDPGDEPDKILNAAKASDIKLTAIYNTHGHIDHVGAAGVIQKKLNIPFAIHPAEPPLKESIKIEARLFGLSPAIDVPKTDMELKEGTVVKIGSTEGKVLFTPGHTPGGVCFLFEEYLFAGDTLFAGSIGRSDFPGGNGKQLIKSIKEKLLSLNDNIKVLSGHGPATTIGTERVHNPFL
jgi:glyoxylase-like metal-dependent hydrolase (beta-lactamase superfamily II)